MKSYILFQKQIIIYKLLSFIYVIMRMVMNWTTFWILLSFIPACKFKLNGIYNYNWAFFNLIIFIKTPCIPSLHSILRFLHLPLILSLHAYVELPCAVRTYDHIVRTTHCIFFTSYEYVESNLTIHIALHQFVPSNW